MGDGNYSSHSLDEVAGMIRLTLSAYEVKVACHFLHNLILQLYAMAEVSYLVFDIMPAKLVTSSLVIGLSVSWVQVKTG